MRVTIVCQCTFVQDIDTQEKGIGLETDPTAVGRCAEFVLSDFKDFIRSDRNPFNSVNLQSVICRPYEDAKEEAF